MRYFPQEKKYTCVLACLRMILSHFIMNIPNEFELELELGTTEKGTQVDAALLYLQRLGFWWRKIGYNELSIDTPIICLSKKDEVVHMTIIVCKQNEKVQIYDPEKGILEVDFQEIINHNFIEIGI